MKHRRRKRSGFCMTNTLNEKRIPLLPDKQRVTTDNVRVVEYNRFFFENG
jgi:hypothetical protein